MQQNIINSLRIVFALMCSVAWFGFIPVYGEDFGGCEIRGFHTLETGCSSWPEFFRGFGVVFLFALITPRHIIFPLFAIVFVTILSLAGGAENLNIGENSLQYDLEHFLWLAGSQLPFLLGGFTGLLSSHYLIKITK